MRTALLISIFGLQALAQDPATSGEKGSIEGVVINQVTSAAVKKAQVTLGEKTAFTDSGGAFAFEQLPAGSYQIFATHPSFPGTTTGREMVSVDLRPGEKKKDVSIALVPGVAIDGRVLDEDGDPISNCSVQVLRYGYQRGKKELQQVGGDSTNDRGEYRIFNLAGGKYYLKTTCSRLPTVPRAFAPKGTVIDQPEESYAEQFYPGSSDASGATRVSPAPGTELRDIDFRIRKIRSVSVMGKVARPEGVDVNQFTQVVAIAKNSSERNWSRRAAVKPTGEFEIHGLLPGSYGLSATNYNQDGQLFGRVDIEVGDSPVRDLLIPMTEGVTLTGTVEMESRPSPPSPSNQPVPAPQQSARRVWLFPADNFMKFQRPNSEVSDDGTFTVTGVTPGEWQLHLEPLMQGTYVKSVRLGDQEISPERFTISPGSAGPLKVKIGANPGEIEGTVQSERPQGNAGAVVVLVPDRDPQAAFTPNQQTITDGTGHFALPGVAPGRYHLYAMEAANNMFPVVGNLVAQGGLQSRAEEVTIEEGGRLTKQLKAIPSGVIADALKEIE